MLYFLVISFAFIIIAALGAYAGRLLYLLKQQNAQRRHAIAQRVARICESVEVICKAMEQQQCELSEGAIRVCNLLNALPVADLPDFNQQFPAMYSLFEQVRHFAVLQEREALSKKEKYQQDKSRGQIESEYESRVLAELTSIKQYCQRVLSQHS